MSSFFGIPGATPDENVMNQQRAGRNVANVMRETGAAYSNKRQADRDMYGDALNNRAAMYQGAMNMLGSSGGGVPNTAGLSRENNPLTLRDTTIGSTYGSNAMGWNNATQGTSHGVPIRTGGANGIVDYLNGTGIPVGSGTGINGTQWNVSNAYTGLGGAGSGQPNLNTAPMNGGGPNGAPATAPPTNAGNGFNFGPRKP